MLTNTKLLLLSFMPAVFVGCTSGNIGMSKIIKMNEDEFKELSSISVEDETGFKYVKSALGDNKFKQVTTTTKNQVITKEDEDKIKAILKKY